MAFFFEETNRLVIPNWRSFSNTLKIGELNGCVKLNVDNTFKPNISDIVQGWEEHKTIGMAGDLVSVAIVSKQTNNPNVKNAANFIIQNKELVSKELLRVAKTLLNNKTLSETPMFDSSSLDAFQERSNLYSLYKKINDLKANLRLNPFNSILWVEIARYYSILGQINKAERSIKNAFYLSPENRFTLRSMVRFFVSIDKPEIAHDLIKSLNITKHDPWVMATEISLASKRDRYSTFTKRGLELVKNKNFHPFHLSELNSALGTVELKHSFKKSKKLFGNSLISPNDNSYAQAEWVSHKEKGLISFDKKKGDILNNFEAEARRLSEKGLWENAIEYSKFWFLDMPFSRESILFAGQIASNNLNNHNEASYVYKAGLTAHPSDQQMLNNLIYSLCIDNKLGEAEKFILRYPSNNKTNLQSQICFTATKGLFNYRKKEY